MGIKEIKLIKGEVYLQKLSVPQGITVPKPKLTCPPFHNLGRDNLVSDVPILSHLPSPMATIAEIPSFWMRSSPLTKRNFLMN